MLKSFQRSAEAACMTSKALPFIEPTNLSFAHLFFEVLNGLKFLEMQPHANFELNMIFGTFLALAQPYLQIYKWLVCKKS